MYIFCRFDEVSAIRKPKMRTFSITGSQILFAHFLIFATNEQKNRIPVYRSQHYLQVQNFVEIALSHTVSEINALLRFTQKFRMAAKSAGKAIFEKSHQQTAYTLQIKSLLKLLYLTPFLR